MLWMRFRFHQQLKTWFQRLKPPTRSDPRSEQGHVAFFNWCRPAKQHPLVQAGAAEPYPSTSVLGPDSNNGALDVDGHDHSENAQAAAHAAQTRASAGWAFMQVRDFKFEFMHLCAATPAPGSTSTGRSA